MGEVQAIAGAIFLGIITPLFFIIVWLIMPHIEIFSFNQLDLSEGFLSSSSLTFIVWTIALFVGTISAGIFYLARCKGELREMGIVYLIEGGFSIISLSIIKIFLVFMIGIIIFALIYIASMIETISRYYIIKKNRPKYLEELEKKEEKTRLISSGAKKRLLGMIKSEQEVNLDLASQIINVDQNTIRRLIYDLIGENKVEGTFQENIFLLTPDVQSPLKKSKETSNYISEALNIIDSAVKFELGSIIVEGGGSEGIVMEAVKKLETAFQLHPEDPLLHYAYASCLHLALQYKIAKEEMKKCVINHPDFLIAKLSLEGWEKWMGLFKLPHFGKNTKKLPPVLAQKIKTNVLLAVRDGINPRATLFLRDFMGDFQDLQALKSARISLASVISTVIDPQVIGIYARIHDNPTNPYNIEDINVPFTPRGEYYRTSLEFLCLQNYIDLVIIDKNDRVILNKKLPIPQNMKMTNNKIFKMLELSEGNEISNIQLSNALMRHTQKFKPSDIQY